MQVNIKCKQVVEYNQTVEMTEEDFEALSDFRFGDDVMERRNPVEFNIVRDHLDLTDITDSDDEFLSVEIDEAD